MNVSGIHAVETPPAPTPLVATTALAGQDILLPTHLYPLAHQIHAQVCGHCYKSFYLISFQRVVAYIKLPLYDALCWRRIISFEMCIHSSIVL